MEDWAEVQRLFHREGLTKRTIARRLGMSRTTVVRLLGLREPRSYHRPARGSLVDPFADEIAKLLETEPDAPPRSSVNGCVARAMPVASAS